MTEQPRSTAQLMPEEWKQLCLLNLGQLHTFLQSIPSATETGASNLTEQHVAMIEAQIGRTATFLNAWRRARIPGGVADQAAVREEAAAVPVAEKPASNGAAPKRKGGWPRGKPRKPANATTTQ